MKRNKLQMIDVQLLPCSITVEVQAFNNASMRRKAIKEAVKQLEKSIKTYIRPPEQYKMLTGEVGLIEIK